VKSIWVLSALFLSTVLPTPAQSVSYRPPYDWGAPVDGMQLRVQVLVNVPSPAPAGLSHLEIRIRNMGKDKPDSPNAEAENYSVIVAQPSPGLYSAIVVAASEVFSPKSF
jgi:hypothetical protein